MKLTALEQACLKKIAEYTQRYGSCGAGGIANPKDREDKRQRKLVDNGLAFYVGVGKPTKHGYTGGCGLIPATMYDTAKHTILPIR